jgi:hypothetical protein
MEDNLTVTRALTTFNHFEGLGGTHADPAAVHIALRALFYGTAVSNQQCVTIPYSDS